MKYLSLLCSCAAALAIGAACGEPLVADENFGFDDNASSQEPADTVAWEISGTVRDPRGRAIGGAVVQWYYYWDEKVHHVTTDERGRYRIRVTQRHLAAGPSIQFPLRAFAPNRALAPPRRLATVPPGGSLHGVDFELPPVLYEITELANPQGADTCSQTGFAGNRVVGVCNGDGGDIVVTWNTSGVPRVRGAPVLAQGAPGLSDVIIIGGNARGDIVGSGRDGRWNFVNWIWPNNQNRPRAVEHPAPGKGTPLLQLSAIAGDYLLGRVAGEHFLWNINRQTDPVKLTLANRAPPPLPDPRLELSSVTSSGQVLGACDQHPAVLEPREQHRAWRLPSLWPGLRSDVRYIVPGRLPRMLGHCAQPHDHNAPDQPREWPCWWANGHGPFLLPAPHNYSHQWATFTAANDRGDVLGTAQRIVVTFPTPPLPRAANRGLIHNLNGGLGGFGVRGNLQPAPQQGPRTRIEEGPSLLWRLGQVFVTEVSAISRPSRRTALDLGPGGEVLLEDGELLNPPRANDMPGPCDACESGNACTRAVCERNRPRGPMCTYEPQPAGTECPAGQCDGSGRCAPQDS